MSSTLQSVLRVLIGLPALLFLVLGLRWILDPSGAAAELDMALLEAPGRGTQIGDIGGFFLALAVMIGLALYTAERTWFLAPALMLGAVAVYRTLAWALHDAGFSASSVGVEVVVASLLVFASSRLGPLRR